MVDLSDLRAVPAARARLDAAELTLIDQARRDGATWADIAEALGLTSRQAAEQRRLRLATAAMRPPQDLDDGYGDRIAALRTAAIELHRRIGADRRWDRRFTRAALVRETLAATPDAPAGSLFALVTAVVNDLEAVTGPPASGPPASGPRASGPPASGPPASGPPASGPPAPGSSASGSPASGPPASGPPAPGSSASGPSAPGPSAPGPSAPGPPPSGGVARPAVPGPTRAAIDRLRAALASAFPR